MSNKSALTEKEMRLLALSWQCMKSQPDIDYDKLAILSGYTPGSTRTLFGGVRKKLREAAGDASSNPPDTTTTKTKTAANGKRARNENGNENDTPKKARKTTTGARRSPKKNDKKKLEAGEDDDILTTLKKEAAEDDGFGDGGFDGFKMDEFDVGSGADGFQF